MERLLNREESVRSRAYRTLRSYTAYQAVELDSIPHYFDNSLLRTNEKPIGIYENISGQREESILVTTLGLLVFLDSQWVVIDYERIENVEVRFRVPNEKRSVDGLIIQMPEQAIIVPVRGSQGNFRDAWPFLTFLRRVADRFHAKE